MFNVFCKSIACNIKRIVPSLCVMPFCLTISPTYMCNLKCKTCNIWKESFEDELSLGEYLRLFRSMRTRIPWIIITGGEPFLRDNLELIIEAVCKSVNPALVTIASNGTLTGSIKEKVKYMLASLPSTQFRVNISIDGTSVLHDYIRGIKGTFDLAMTSYKALKDLQAKNLTVGINTIISRFNMHAIDEILTYSQTLSPDSHAFEFAEKRLELRNCSEDVRPEKEICLAILEKILACNYIKTRGVSLNIAAHMRKEYYLHVKKILSDERGEEASCFAGLAAGHLASNGEVWNCCVRANSLGNVRNYDYDLRKIWFSQATEDYCSKARKEMCRCSSVSANYVNFLCNIHKLGKIGLSLASELMRFA